MHSTRFLALAAAALAAAAILGLTVTAMANGDTGLLAPVDFWNYDPRTGERISNASPGVAPGELAELYGGRG